MDNKLQILTFIFSFIYGFIYFYMVRINRYLTKNDKRFIKYLDTSLFTLDSVLVYVVINYKINNGYFHLYFLFMLILGFLVAYYTETSVKLLKNKLLKRK